MAGTGYVGLSIATLLSQHHHVTAVDIVPEKVEMINNAIQFEEVSETIAIWDLRKRLQNNASLDLYTQSVMYWEKINRIYVQEIALNKRNSGITSKLAIMSFSQLDDTLYCAGKVIKKNPKCVKAVFEFMGISYTEEELYAHVLVMEQIMSTGGGWQDQVGGVTNGIKYITSKPGLDQQLRVEHIELQPETKKELNERFCLIYTGQRRLARNLLRDVVGRYVGNEPDSLYRNCQTIKKI